MDYMKSIGKYFEFTSNTGRIYDPINERLSLWFNRLYAYSKSQPILCVTCLILFFCLILILLIYRFKRKKANSDSTKAHTSVSSEERTVSSDKKRLEQTTMTTKKKQLKSTKGKLIDYDQTTKNDKNTETDRYESKYDSEYSLNNDTNNLNYQNNQKDQRYLKDLKDLKNQNDQIKQFKKKYLMNQRKQLNQFTQMNDQTELNRTQQMNIHNEHNIHNYHNHLNHSNQLNGKVNYGTKFSKEEINRKFDKRFKCEIDTNRDQVSSRLRNHDLDKNRCALNEYDDENQFDDCLKNPIRSSFERLDDCCCCLSRNRVLADWLRLNKRREYLEQQINKEICDCFYCANGKSNATDYQLDKKLDVKLSNLNERKPNQHYEDDLASVHADSYGSCDRESECDCRRRCKISKLINDNISTRSNISMNEQLGNLNKQLFDNEYRRLVRRNRQINKTEDNCSCIADNLKNNCLTGYTSWSSHLHIQ